MDLYISEAEQRQERDKARQLRKTRWWQNLIQRTQCYYCQVVISREEVTMDHVVPVSRGGKSVKGNVVAACKECNNRKRSLTPMEWVEFLDRQTQSSKRAVPTPDTNVM